MLKYECGGSAVECLTWDRRIVGLSLTDQAMPGLPEQDTLSSA